MIYKNATIGKVTDVTLAEFGSGDIEVMDCKQFETNLPTLVLKNHDSSNEVGASHNYPPGQTSDELEGFEIAMTFSKPESIDVVIGKLEELKKYFTDNPIGWEIGKEKLEVQNQ